MNVEYALLGPVRVSRTTPPLPENLLWKKSVALVAYLGRAPSGSRSRDHLVDVIWPQSKTIEAGRHSLREYLRIIRRGLGEAAIESEGELVRLANGSVRFDLDDFDMLHRERRWLEAAQLVRGEFMEGFFLPEGTDFDTWLSHERMEWRHRSVEAIGFAAEEALASGDLTLAGELGLRGLHLAPDAQSVLRTTMRALTLSGHPEAAIERCRAVEARLREIGATLEHETVDLMEGIQRRRARGGVEQPETSQYSKRRTPLCGRQPQLAKVMEAWQIVSHGSQGAVCVIQGDRGTGKTRLAEELVSRAELGGGFADTIRVVPSDGDHAGSGLTGLLEGLADAPGAGAASPAVVAACCRWSNAWSERFRVSDESDETLSPGQALTRVVAAVAEEQPVVLLVDDAHFLDEESLGGLHQLVRDTEALPVLTVLTTVLVDQPGEIAEVRSRIGTDIPGCTVTTTVLTPEDLGDLVSWAFPDLSEEQHQRMLRRVQADSGGNQLIAVELLDAVAHGLELSDTTTWPAPNKTLDHTRPGELPDTVVGAIRVGFGRLNPDGQAVLRVLAVADRRLGPSVIAPAAGLDEHAALTALDQLEWERWVVAEPRGYAFTARIVQEVVERDMVTRGQRQRIAGTLPDG